jgi:hypothetical protein
VAVVGLASDDVEVVDDGDAAQVEQFFKWLAAEYYGDPVWSRPRQCPESANPNGTGDIRIRAGTHKRRKLPAGHGRL